MSHSPQAARLNIAVQALSVLLQVWRHRCVFSLSR